MSARSFAVVSLRGDVPGLDDALDEASTAAADAVGPFRVVVASATDAGEVLSAIAEAEIHTPWVLVGNAVQHELIATIVDCALDGAIGVFGLAGVVVVDGPVPGAVREREVPADATTADDLAAAVRRLAAGVADRSPRVPEAWARVIASSRTDVAVRATLARRALADDPEYSPRSLTPAQLALLRQVARRVMPQGDGAAMDLAARLDRMVAAGESDGWRPTGMSTDEEAYRAGLDALAAIWKRGSAAQDEVIREVIAGTAASGSVLTPGQLSLWFEDARNDLARAWLSHPASLARVGYSGFATGGTGPEPAGYLVLAAGQREEWEPDELGRLQERGDAA
ncbi:gluconate 2-dehydrogenase subunit 3 family protein [Microbacterium imperiale]|uniref:Uncharacterized protein n=1 Tax=Microbacterium imperiale TaxID=33884 RepID=A0A9W6HGU5_9MICO|nr:gluconate 2-dehydrogenase subunit 3 family protein [Microbacterium imperiale]MBP2422002.1 hypothetical protein [Microbacterium imperiale]MDS0200160.1 gluconate 2-dehydrogenase subunit 3 family protein [Microbacterium imperiale]BFE39309.1 hypothetical protein GCM10017544_02650 [Microbacterium imperiale]GLJ79825.1 hypothetical protein GCM10017586_15070 [Microbacterium imperiale]